MDRDDTSTPLDAGHITRLQAQSSAASTSTPLLNRMRLLLKDPLITGPDKHRALTEIGRHVLALARQKISDLPKAPANPATPVRLGVGSVFIDKFMRSLDGFETLNIDLSSAICFELADRFAQGELDMVYVLDAKDNRKKLDGHIVDELRIDLSWVSAPNLVLDTDEPVPIAVYPGDRSAIDALERADRNYRIKFSSPEYLAKVSAVRAGRYLTAMPRNLIEAPLMERKGCDLPDIPPGAAFVAVRGDRNADRFRPILSVLAELTK